MATATVEQGQCLVDIAIQHCGGVGALYRLAGLNGISPTEYVSPGTILNLPEVVNKDVAQYFTDKQLVPATNEASTKFLNQQPRGGINYMQIGVDFIVS